MLDPILKHRITREIYAYWQRLRGNRLAPDRSEIEPADIRATLGDTFILEVTDAGEFRFRLAGTRVCALFGRELKGQNFLRMWTGKDRDTLRSLLMAINLEAASTVIGISAQNDMERSLDLELLLLPIRQTGPGFQRIFGSIAPMSEPYWLGAQPLTKMAVASVRLIWPEENQTFLRHGATLPPEEARVASVTALPAVGRPQRKVAHLTVYEGGRQLGTADGIGESETRH